MEVITEGFYLFLSTIGLRRLITLTPCVIGFQVGNGNKKKKKV